LQKLGLLSKPLEVPIDAIEKCAEAICKKINKFTNAPPEGEQFYEQLNKLKSRAEIFMRHVVVEKRESDKLQSTSLFYLPLCARFFCFCCFCYFCTSYSLLV
jgi:hypothetical protein